MYDRMYTYQRGNPLNKSIKEITAMKKMIINYVKFYRTQRGLSQAELAKMIGVSRNTISSIETGQFNPTAKLALILCIALDKKFEDIFYF